MGLHLSFITQSQFFSWLSVTLAQVGTALRTARWTAVHSSSCLLRFQALLHKHTSAHSSHLMGSQENPKSTDGDLHLPCSLVVTNHRKSCSPFRNTLLGRIKEVHVQKKSNAETQEPARLSSCVGGDWMFCRVVFETRDLPGLFLWPVRSHT